MFENKLPLSEFDIYNANANDHLTLNIESRRAKLSDHSKSLKDNNVWRYIREGSAEEPKEKLLHTFIGPIINVDKGKALKITWVNKLGPMSAMPGMMGNTYLESPPFKPAPYVYDG